MLIARVRRTVAERRLLRRGDHVVVACSGGPDSVALTDVLARLQGELGVTLVVASVDHGLRPEAADDVAHVRRLADGLGVPFRALEVRVPAEGPSLQAAAREARYGALRQLAAREGARRVAVGHTQDDQAETVLARLLRGAGVTGLGGIAPRRRDGVVRPLIDCRREQIRAHLAHRGLEAVSDPSNEDPRFERARLRRAVLPALEAEDPRLVPHLAALADDARASTGVLRRRARRLRDVAGAGPEGTLAADRVAAAPRAVRRELLRAWLREQIGRDAGREHLEALDRALEGRGHARLPGGWVARRQDGRLGLFRAGATPTRSARNCIDRAARHAPRNVDGWQGSC